MDDAKENAVTTAAAAAPGKPSWPLPSPSTGGSNGGAVRKKRPSSSSALPLRLSLGDAEKDENENDDDETILFRRRRAVDVLAHMATTAAVRDLAAALEQLAVEGTAGDARRAAERALEGENRDSRIFFLHRRRRRLRGRASLAKRERIRRDWQRMPARNLAAGHLDDVGYLSGATEREIKPRRGRNPGARWNRFSCFFCFSLPRRRRRRRPRRRAQPLNLNNEKKNDTASSSTNDDDDDERVLTQDEAHVTLRVLEVRGALFGRKRKKEGKREKLFLSFEAHSQKEKKTSTKKNKTIQKLPLCSF
jgi:hypothetical protein